MSNQIQVREKGFSTLEILLALAILTLAITPVILLAFSNQSTSVDSQTNNEALEKAQQQLESVRTLAKQSFSSIQNCDDNSATKCSNPPNQIYSVKDTVNDIDAYTKQVTTEVTYSVSLLRQQKVTLNTALTDWNAVFGGDTCNPTLSGDWTQPQLLGYADIGQNNGATDVDVLAKRAYVTADSSSANQSDFYIVDVSDPNLSNLPILGSVNTGPGLAAVHVAGKYAYVANISTLAQLQVIDISTPSSPFVAANLDVTKAGDTAVGNTLFYSNKRVYLGLTKSSGTEFYVIDVSNPLAPTKKAGFEINSQVNAITVKNNIAYITVPDDPATSGISEQLKVLDVSQADTGSISQINTFSPNPSTMSGQGLFLSKDGKTLYLGQGGANPGNKPNFFVLNMSTPISVSQSASRYISTASNVSVNAISVRSNLAFLWTSDPSLGFQIWNLDNLGGHTPYGALNTEQTATGGFDCDGDIFYVTQKSNKALQIIGPANDL